MNVSRFLPPVAENWHRIIKEQPKRKYRGFFTTIYRVNRPNSTSPLFEYSHSRFTANRCLKNTMRWRTVLLLRDLEIDIFVILPCPSNCHHEEDATGSQIMLFTLSNWVNKNIWKTVFVASRAHFSRRIRDSTPH